MTLFILGIALLAVASGAESIGGMIAIGFAGIVCAFCGGYLRFKYEEAEYRRGKVYGHYIYAAPADDEAFNKGGRNRGGRA